MAALRLKDKASIVSVKVTQGKMTAFGFCSTVLFRLVILVVVWQSVNANASEGPRIDLAGSIIDQVTGTMRIRFQAPTNQGGVIGPRPCSDLLFALVTGFTRHVCRFVDDVTLFVDAPYDSNWTQNTNFWFNLPSPIRLETNLSAPLTESGPFKLTLNTTRLVFPPRINGPSQIPFCVNQTRFNIDADFSAGRPWKNASINLISSPLNQPFSGGSPIIDLNTLTFVIPTEKILSLLGGTWRFSVTLVNALGAQATSFEFDLTTPTSISPLNIPITVRGRAGTKVYKSSDEIRLSVLSQIPPECLPVSVTGTWRPEFSWTVAAVASDNVSYISGVELVGLNSSLPEFVIAPFTLRPKDNAENNYYAVRVGAFARLLAGTQIPLGSSVTFLQIKHSDPIINLRAPSWIENTTDLIIDATSSCDPDYALGCVPLDGRRNLSVPSNLLFNITLRRWESDQFELPQETEYEGDFTDGNANDGYWRVGKIRPGMYRIEVSIKRLKYPMQVFYVRRLVNVVGKPDDSGSGKSSGGETGDCGKANLSLPILYQADAPGDFPIIALERDVPLILRAAGVSDGSSTITWQVQYNDAGPGYAEDEFLPVDDELTLFPDRPTLSISPSALYPGYSYTFRIFSTSNCWAAFGDISFSVNVPPRGGIVQVSPKVGQGFKQVFALQTGGWAVQNPEVQLPLMFEFQYLRKGTRAPITLGTVSASPVLLARLASPRLNCRDNGTEPLVAQNSSILVVCKDALGSSSVSSTTDFTVEPMYTAGVTTVASLPVPVDTLDQTKKLGGTTEEQLQVLSTLSDEAATTECLALALTITEQASLADWRQSVSWQVLQLLQASRLDFRQSNRPPSFSELNVMVSVFSSALNNAFNKLSQTEITAAANLINQLLSDANDAKLFNPSQAPLPLDFGPVFLDVLSGLAKSLKFAREESEGLDPLEDLRPRRGQTSPDKQKEFESAEHSSDEEDSDKHHASEGHVEEKRVIDSSSKRRGKHRELLISHAQPDSTEPCDWDCQTAITLQQALRKLIGLLLTNFAPGSEPRIVRGIDLELTLSREYRTNVGSSDGVNELVVDPQGPKFRLPPAVLSDPNRIRNSSKLRLSDTVDVCAIRFRFNPLELVKSANLPPGVDLSNGYGNITRHGVMVPNFTVQEVHTLLFLDNTDPGVNYDPFNLTMRINITIPFPADYVPPDANSSQEIACGFWDDSFEGWSAEGCYVAEISLPQRYVVCSCNHASDFAAWNAFLANLGGGDIGAVATIAIIVVSVLVPGILVMWLVAFLWARNKDEEDAHAVQLGALIVLTKNRLRLMQQQKRFFRILRANAQRPVGAPSALIRRPVTSQEGEDEWIDDETSVSKTISTKDLSVDQHTGCLHQASLFGAWLKALYYDHSFFGIFTRFDPFYTRTQRITVFAAVLVGNLFAASFFFEFKTASDLSPGVLIVSVIAAALVVAIPVKISVRWLFRATEQELGSPMHRVAQIYRISELQAGDLLPAYANAAERADSQMLFAFKDYYSSKSILVALQMLRDELLREDGRRRGSNGGCCCHRRNLRIQAAAENRRRSLIMRLGMKVDESGNASLEEVEKALSQAEAKTTRYLDVLRRASERSAEEWSKVPKRPNIRVETMRRQQSSLMRFATLLYDETETRARSRTKYFRHGFIYFAWAFVIVYLLGGLAYCTRWVLGRTSYRGILDPNSTQAEQQADADGIIVAWLLSAVVGVAVGVFLSEPVVQFIRFGLAPFLLRRFGNGTVSIFSRRHGKYKIDPNSASLDPWGHDSLGKPIPARRIPESELLDPPKLQSKSEIGTTEGARASPASPTELVVVAEPGHTGAGPSPRKSLKAKYRQKQRNRGGGESETTRVILESLADVVEALA